MHENDLKEMKRRVDAIWSSLSNREQIAMLKRHDILADREEKQDPRAKAEKLGEFDSEVEHVGDMSKAMTERMIDAFEEEYDHDTVNNLHGGEIAEYKQRHKQYELLKKHLRKLNE